MPLILDWKDVAARLAWTVFAGAIIGINRGEHGRPAGLRTTLLVCLAASLSMILANLMLATAGKKGDSFIQLDLMRLPLGVLSGMGFIGAGTVLRKGDRVLGITTAATLWFVTLMGLCFGAGQTGLGLAALAVAVITLWGLKHVEGMIHRDAQATLKMTIRFDGPDDDALRRQLSDAGLAVQAWGVEYGPDHRKICCPVQWQPPNGNAVPPDVVGRLAKSAGVVFLCWQPQGVPGMGESEHDEPKGAGPSIAAGR